MKSSVSLISPFRCRMWAFHDRLDEHVSEATCKAEIDSFMTHGQLVPVLGRPVTDDTKFDVELIYGARRLFIARHLNKSLLVEVREMTDREAIIAMDIENRQRRDVSPYERGVSYARWLRSGHFRAQEEIASALRLSRSKVSRLLKLAQLPSIIVAAFGSPVEIREGWGIALAEALQDPLRRQAMIRRARAIAVGSERPAARVVYRELMAASLGERRSSGRARDEVVKGSNGTPLFRIRQQRNGVAIVLPGSRSSIREFSQIRDYIVRKLESGSDQKPTNGPPTQNPSVDRDLRVPVRRWLIGRTGPRGTNGV